MGAFGGLILTNRGRNLQVKAQTGVELHFTRIAIGDGDLGGSSILELNALKNERKSLEITKLKVLTGGQAVVGSVLNNQDITAGFYFREIGVFATDPDVGEILYCYANAGSTADYIPAGSGGTDLIEKTIDIVTLVGNAANVTATIDSLIYETPENAQAKADQAEQNAKDYTDQEIVTAKSYTDQQLAAAKAYTDEKLTNLSNNDTVQGMQKEIANLNLQLQASQRVPNGYTFGTDGVNIFGMNIDFTKTTAVGALSAGTTNIPVQDVTGFKAGQEVTIYDDTNIERVTISGIDPDNKILSVSALTKSYKDGANIARTMAVADTINKCLKFGGWSTQTTNTVTDATVVNQAYDTSGNGGRKLVRLSNGWLVVAVYQNDANDRRINLYVNKNDGQGWVLLKGLSFGTQTYYASGFAIVSKGTTVYLVYGFYTTDVYLDVIDCLTANGEIVPAGGNRIDSSQIGFSGISLAINDTGTELHATWSSKNSAISNSFNIRYAKGTINTDGSVSWSAVEQVTTMNASSYSNAAINPCIVIKDGIPYIFTSSPDTIFTSTGANAGSAITVFKRDKSLPITSGAIHSSWSFRIIYNVSTSYTQSSPSACVDKNGRIWVTWMGRDSTDSAVYNIRITYNDDGGQVWSTPTKLTSGNTYDYSYPSITVNKNNDVFVLFYGYDVTDGYNDIRMIKYSSGSWGNVTVVSAGTTSHKTMPSALYDLTIDFSTPLFIYRDSSGRVGFCGTWTAGSTVPLLENDIRFTVKDTDEVVAWTERDELAGFTVDAQLNGQAMTKTSVSGEDQFTGTLPSVQPAELRLTMTRANTADDVKISKILGGVA